jgi:hypothetical protein
MSSELGTTNLLLAILAAVSVLEALLLIGVGIAVVSTYRRLMRLMGEFEIRHLMPVMARFDGILDDVKGVTATIREETERVDHAIHASINRIDDTADRVRSNMRAVATAALGVVRTVRGALQGTRHRMRET